MSIKDHKYNKKSNKNLPSLKKLPVGLFQWLLSKNNPQDILLAALIEYRIKNKNVTIK